MTQAQPKTVGQLIAELQQFDPEMPVVCYEFNGEIGAPFVDEHTFIFVDGEPKFSRSGIDPAGTPSAMIRP